jgi:ABC-type iron transport system FetAB permease component
VPLTALASRFILRQAPWWEPSRYVPLLGMVLGNAISAVTLGSNHVLSVFEYVVARPALLLTLAPLMLMCPFWPHSSQRDTVEVLLTHGASRFEACRPVAAEALRTALLPVLNQMSVVGLISIPGVSLLRPSNERRQQRGADTGRFR